jgi:hypothetical protein
MISCTKERISLNMRDMENANAPMQTSQNQCSGGFAPLSSSPCHFSSQPCWVSVALPAFPSCASLRMSLQYSSFLHSASAASIAFMRLLILRSSASPSGFPDCLCSSRCDLAASKRSMRVERSWRREFWKMSIDMMAGTCAS